MKKLNLGCGTSIMPKSEGWINVDKQKHKNVDKSFDFNKFPYPFKESTFEYILIDNVLEHLNEPANVIKELWRICKKRRQNSKSGPHLPYYNAYNAYSDVTHKTFFNELTFVHLLEGNTYELNPNQLYKIVILKRVPQRFLRFIPMPILNILKRFLGNILVTLDVTAEVKK